MKLRIAAMAAVAALGMSAASANAASVITNVVDGGVAFTITTTPAADLGGYTPALTPAGYTMIADFDNPLDPNFSMSGANIFPGGVGGAAAPPGDNSKYNSTQPGSPFTLTALNGKSLTSFSFYMGSPDDGTGFYNQLDFVVKGGPTLSRKGTSIWGGNQIFSGNQSQGFMITYTFDTDSVTSLKFSQVGSPAFEFDNISGVLAVPEPATWAMMILGFGAAGAMIRRRRMVAA